MAMVTSSSTRVKPPSDEKNFLNMCYLRYNK
jgi:hypothetical protein